MSFSVVNIKTFGKTKICISNNINLTNKIKTIKSTGRMIIEANDKNYIQEELYMDKT